MSRLYDYLEGRTPANPCKVAGVCDLADEHAWGVTLGWVLMDADYWLARAQERAAKGKEWTPAAKSAATSIAVIHQMLLESPWEKNAPYGNEYVAQYVDASLLSEESRLILKDFAEGPENTEAPSIEKNPSKSSGGGGGMLIVGIGAFLAVGLIVVVASRRR